MMKSAIAVVLLSMSSATIAQTGLYAGFGVGQSRVDIRTGEERVALRNLGYTSTVTARETSTGLKLFGGYQFNRFFALELGYADFGTFKETATVTAPVTGTAEFSFDAHAYSLDAVGTLPLFSSSFAAFGKVGAALATVEGSPSTCTVAGLACTAAAEEQYVPKLGVGLQYGFAKNLALRVEWERYLNVGDPDITGESHIDLRGLSLSAQF